MYSVFITGTNSGIGLEFVKQYAADGYQVFASYLPAGDKSQLQQLAVNYNNIALIPLDITQESEIKKVAQELKSDNIDILINNAGIYGDGQELDEISKELMVQVFTVNAAGPLLVTKHLIDHVSRSSLKTIVSISSRMGSIASTAREEQQGADAYAYRASKAALNSIMQSVAIDTHARGTRVLLFHPGHVKTAMGGPHAKIDTYTSVSGIRNVIEKAPRSLEKLFYNYDGSLIPW
jgi:NAD(P)-dependent dehydrogenase (short-subunit alcohol dehydrogenase family)